MLTSFERFISKREREREREGTLHLIFSFIFNGLVRILSDVRVGSKSRPWPVTGSGYGTTYISACMHNSQTIAICELALTLSSDRVCTSAVVLSH